MRYYILDYSTERKDYGGHISPYISEKFKDLLISQQITGIEIEESPIIFEFE